jgi:hypothetical protein
MTFELVRFGWPNTAAILALAIVPMLAFTAPDRLQGLAAEQDAPAFCATVTEPAALLVAAASEPVVQ